ncbi:universal stress protein [Streptomyces sp. STR69]|uniref:universal stress protein n=1 Tax=Streptomyces sp. STR69 TaxID=1796942 RepID=UPI0021C6B4EF|nr:universal stress protein [Streptomyces sp. STR69]
MERTIVVGVDGSVRSRVAADWAAREALRRGLLLQVVHVSERSGTGPSGPCSGLGEPLPGVAERELMSRPSELTVHEVRVDGEPAARLLALGASAELLVLGMRGAGGCAGQAVGSVAGAVAERSARPVVLVPGGPACAGTGWRTDKVALGVDARRPDEAAIGFAFDRASRANARLRVVHAWTMPEPGGSALPFVARCRDRAAREDEEMRLLSDVLRPWHEKYPRVQVLEDVVHFGAAEALVRASGRAELLVAGRRENRLGSALKGLVEQAGCPVVVVPG